MNQNYIRRIQENMSIPYDKALVLSREGTIVVLKKNQNWLSEGERADKLAFIIQGAMRSYLMNDKGEEINLLLQVNKDFIGDYESYISGKKASLYIKAMIETELFVISKDTINDLAQQDVFWMDFKIRMSDYAFLEAKRRIEDLLLFTPEERYLNLLRKSREVLQKIPQKYISTFLGITPQSLSRIRRRIMK
ncbi:Crp/Fnr family transcriptional regulator [Sphingobacterium paucimobilis]|nr:Crp/Fnr family transcriptional regulator [Sphingobacterium paucimobilis]